MTDPLERDPELTRLCVDAVRVLAMDAVQKADSGHPGTPMALAPLGYVLWNGHLRHNPENPDWMNRDRFVLSAGHASMLLYSMLYLSGYGLELEELMDFRQLDSRTPGHPEHGLTPGVETTTGPLGQGVTNSVGMAMAERWLAARFNRPGHEIVDHHTYAICSDGDLMEGVSHEAADLAGHQRLGKLTWIFDDNRITIDGSTDLATSIDQGRRFEAYGWQVLHVDDGNDLEALDKALTTARSETEHPTLIIVRTTIGYGSPNKAGTAETHGAPLGQDEVDATKENLGYPKKEPFWVDDRALDAWRETADRGRRLEEEWQERFDAYRSEHPELARELEAMVSGELPPGWDAGIPDLTGVDKAKATRSWSGQVLQAIASGIPNLIGGSADLAGSNKTDIDGADDLMPGTPGGRIMHFGVREHGMGGVLNGLALHGGVRPFGGTFLIFSDYMRPAIRLAGLMELPVVWVFTHDSIGLGEDGPTHQPIEQLASLRAVPNVMDLRPADGPETAEAWRMALTRTDGPSFLSLTRQSLPALDRGSLANAEGLHRGGYVLAEASGGRPHVILLASGSEVHIALEARSILEGEGLPTRLVSMPSWYLFEQQDESYREEVLPSDVSARVSIEAAASLGWSRWIGPRGASVSMERFGASAPWKDLYERFGFTPSAVAEKGQEVYEAARSGAGV